MILEIISVILVMKKLYFYDCNDIEMTITINVGTNSVWISIDKYDYDKSC